MTHILVVDDNEIVRNTVAMCLDRCGYQTFTARNGLEAVQLFSSCPDVIDLVLTDVTMPVMGGGDAVNLIRKTRPDAKVICMTGYLDDVCPNGVAVLPKPFGFDALRRTVAEVLRSPEPAEARV
jgi:CheY-like chemotaxis protein